MWNSFGFSLYNTYFVRSISVALRLKIGIIKSEVDAFKGGFSWNV